MNSRDLETVLHDLGFTYLREVNSSNDTNFMFCCPWHGERHPSCGISAEKEIGACFACGQTFTLPYLVSYMKDWSMRQAHEWLEEKFNIKKQVIDEKTKVRYYDDLTEEALPQRLVLPEIKLAPFRSGKIAHQYLLDRGFTKSTFKRFKFGWDNEKQRITIPIFWEDDTLAGFIGRAVIEPKIAGKDNPQYKKVYGGKDKYLVYEFERSKLLYPLQMFELPEDKSVILVEGSLDSPWMHQLGFPNTLSLLNSKISGEQVELLSKLGIKRVILMLDNDGAGRKGMEQVYEKLKNDFVCYRVTYPEGRNDPQELTREEVKTMLENKKPFRVLEIRKLE